MFSLKPTNQHAVDLSGNFLAQTTNIKRKKNTFKWSQQSLMLECSSDQQGLENSPKYRHSVGMLHLPKYLLHEDQLLQV